ncbi:MAG: hypothetical protein ACI8S6_004819 [Myxococcota bacterium]
MSTSWPTINYPGQLRLLGNLEPEEVLYAFDNQPWIFTSRSELFGLLLVYLAGEDDDQGCYHYLVTNHRDETVIEQLKAGQITVYNALTSGELLFVVDRSFDGAWLAAAPRRVTQLPEDVLPERETLLLPEHEPQPGGHLLDAMRSNTEGKEAKDQVLDSLHKPGGFLLYNLLVAQDVEHTMSTLSPQQLEELSEIMGAFSAFLVQISPARRAELRRVLSEELKRSA